MRERSMRVKCVGKAVLPTFYLIMSLIVMAGCVASGGKVEGTMGVVDPALLLSETSAGKKVKESLGAFSKNRQALIEIEEKELRRMEEDLGRQASVLSAPAKREREELFRRRMTEYQQKVGEMNREVQEKQKDALEVFREKMELVVGTVSKRLGLRIIMDKGKGGPTVYSEESLDITGHVIEEFNRAYP